MGEANFLNINLIHSFIITYFMILFTYFKSDVMNMITGARQSTMKNVFALYLI
jgi:hypothetical protein